MLLVLGLAALGGGTLIEVGLVLAHRDARRALEATRRREPVRPTSRPRPWDDSWVFPDAALDGLAR
jgi:hypothetical protein